MEASKLGLGAGDPTPRHDSFIGSLPVTATVELGPAAVPRKTTVDSVEVKRVSGVTLTFTLDSHRFTLIRLLFTCSLISSSSSLLLHLCASPPPSPSTYTHRNHARHAHRIASSCLQAVHPEDWRQDHLRLVQCASGPSSKLFSSCQSSIDANRCAGCKFPQLPSF